MEAMQLKKIQEEIDLLVRERAKNNKLLEPAVGPICDGVADEDAYLRSSLKVLWLLLEPYDEDYDRGGGWSLPKDCFLKPKEKDFEKIAQQTIAYSMWCARNRKRFPDAPSPEEVFHELTSIAWVNISKMPAKKRSHVQTVVRKYKENWKDIIDRQIELLSPGVIIIAGSHFKSLYGKELFVGGRNEYEKCFPDGEGRLVYLYRLNKIPILKADHPAYWKNRYHKRWRPNLKRDTYVNAIADALVFLENHQPL